jgi:hypothetical protein
VDNLDKAKDALKAAIRIGSRLVRDRRIQQEAFEYGSDLVHHVVDSTSKLLGSGMAVGVVKRVTTAAIDGWIIKRDGDDANVLHAVLATEPIYLRSDYPAPLLCVEVKAGIDVGKILPYLMATHNSATGLPLPFDMIDQNVGLPRGFTREFVEEIEANHARTKVHVPWWCPCLSPLFVHMFVYVFAFAFAHNSGWLGEECPDSCTFHPN